IKRQTVYASSNLTIKERKKSCSPSPPSQFHDSTTYSKQHRRSIRPLRHRKPNAQSNPSVVKTRLTSVLTIVAALVGFAFAGVQSTQAAILVVNSTADTNVCDNTTCTLRG